MLTEVPRQPSVTARMNVRLFEKPTAAMAVAPSPPTTIWLTKLSTSMRTNSMLTGTAMRAISREGSGGVRSRRARRRARRGEAWSERLSKAKIGCRPRLRAFGALSRNDLTAVSRAQSFIALMMVTARLIRSRAPGRSTTLGPGSVERVVGLAHDRPGPRASLVDAGPLADDLETAPQGPPDLRARAQLGRAVPQRRRHLEGHVAGHRLRVDREPRGRGRRRGRWRSAGRCAAAGPRSGHVRRARLASAAAWSR